MEDTVKNILVQKICKRFEDLQNPTLININEELTNIKDEIQEDLDKKQISDSIEGKLREKKFIARNSILTDLFDIKHFGTIYNIFIVIIAFLCLQIIFTGYFKTGSIDIGISVIHKTFKGFLPLCGLWICMFATMLSLFIIFNVWARVRVQMKPNSFQIYIWDRVWLNFYILYQIIFLCGFAYLAHLNNYKFAPGFAFICEQLRFMMKSHAFVRSNIPRVLNYNELLKLQPLGQKSIVPKFSKYLYFLFAPTLIYQDNYPRTKEIRWKFLLQSIFESVVIFFIYVNIAEQFFLDAYEDYGLVHYDMKTLLFQIIRLSCPSLFAYIVGFYLFLHSWHNAWAEALQFADRMFYKDWWNSSNFGEYFRNWNVIVQDWLYIYIYKDLYENFGGNKLFSFVSVFIISAIFHEYLMTMSSKIFYPILFVFFTVVGTLAIFTTRQIEKINKNVGNILLWCGLGPILSGIISLYIIEFYARANCNYHNDTIYGFIIPRSWLCNK